MAMLQPRPAHTAAMEPWRMPSLTLVALELIPSVGMEREARLRLGGSPD
jgi:hypothetical protein